ncbi:siphovirus Gp157 family protein [Halotia wernerae UHCC 0503]|nr:siphovirus Gp157 family protein [Halotia wernerae UHCC 0503]
MPTLRQLQSTEQHLMNELNNLISSLDELNLSPSDEQTRIEEFLQHFLANEQELKDKVNASCWYLTSLQKDADYYREQAQRMQAAARVTENRIASFKAYLMYVLEKKGGKLPTKDFPKLAIRGTAASVEIDNEYQGEIPDEYIKVRELSDVVNKSAIAKDLKAGVELPFARLMDKGQALFGLK